MGSTHKGFGFKGIVGAFLLLIMNKSIGDDVVLILTSLFFFFLLVFFTSCTRTDQRQEQDRIRISLKRDPLKTISSSIETFDPFCLSVQWLFSFAHQEELQYLSTLDLYPDDNLSTTLAGLGFSIFFNKECCKMPSLGVYHLYFFEKQ